MKKQLLISLGILVILIIIGVWVYLFVYGAPKNAEEIFGNFGMRGGETTFSPQEDNDEDGSSEEPEREKALRQLTTRPVAGAVFTNSAIRYAERGTGYVYEITLEGQETQVTNTTIPQTVAAEFSPNGTRVIMTAQRNERNETIVADIDTGSGNLPGTLEGVSLPERAENIAWEMGGEGVYYLLPTVTGSSGYLYDLALDTSTTLFEIPLKDIVVVWGEDSHYVYTTPTARQTGYVYRLLESSLEYVTKGAPGLMAIPYEEGVVITHIDTGTGSLISTIPYDSTDLPFPLIPDKCVAVPLEDSQLYCASTPTPLSGEYPDDWYKGVRSFVDSLWKVDLTTGESTLLSYMLSESGREIDVSSIGSDPSGDYIYFINKNDGTLWLLDTTKI